ncbi:transcription factor A, mitochondrial [Nelusetta ayraudi]|uniref:transcription factor A, mitochondrial n=1 Tax=Nelusetta ayraudi TaxID=303726 RepID=UPI003F726E7F
MAPFSFLAAAVGCFARRSLSVVSCTTSPLPRYTTVLPAAYINPLNYLSSQPSGPPKRPLNGYMKYVLKQQPIISTQYPDIKSVDIIRKIAQQWRTMSPDEKRPFQEASLRDREKFKIDLQQYQAQLSPAQVQQQALEKRQRLAKRKAIRKKRELTSLGKPKRPRSPFNIFISEHFEEARGTTTQAKMKSLMEDWRNLLSQQQKQVYTQLAEDDKIRYKNEMKSWEDHMVEIGREDLIRERTATKKKLATKKSVAKVATKSAKSKSAAKGAGKTKPKTTKKTIRRS